MERSVTPQEGQRSSEWFQGAGCTPEVFEKELAHDHMGHAGIKAMVRILRVCVVWPGIYKDVSGYGGHTCIFRTI